MRHDFWMAPLVLIGTACAHAAPQATPAPQRSISDVDHQRLAFVQAACGGCHAVEPPHLSPNPLAPRWVDIANRPELDEQSIAAWLRDAHNYPEEMDFDLDPDQAEMIADYMLSLRSPDYRRMPD